MFECSQLTCAATASCLLQVLKNLAVMKDINGNSVLVRVIRRRRQAAYKLIVPIERLFDTISLHHRDSVGFRGEKKLWNFVSFCPWAGGIQIGAAAAGLFHAGQ